MPIAPYALALAAAVLAVTLASVAIAVRRMRRRPAPFVRDPGSVAVTILRPVCGLETFSEETLGSAFHLAHAKYEIVFCVASSADPIVPVVRRLMAEHPEVPARLLVGDDRVSANPKLNNCIKGWAAARHDWVAIADSNVLMPPDYLDRLLSAWRADTGLVCSTPLGMRPDGFWAEVEVAFLNTLQARWQYAGEAVGLGFAQGKSMLFRRSLLDANGGLRALGAEIAEDAAATKLVRGLGLRVRLVDRPFDQPLGLRRARDVLARQLRWARLRRVTFPFFFLPEILTSPLGPATAAALGAPLVGVAPAAAAGGVLLLWWGAEAAMAWRLGWPLFARFPLACAIRDLAIPAIYAAALVGRTVTWRGTVMSIADPRPPLDLGPSRI